MYYINLFLVSSIFGFLIETSLKTFVFHSMNNGIMFGPWVPVYGFGVVVIVLVGDYILKKDGISSLWKNILIFGIVSFLLTLLEFIGGNLIEMFFHEIYWDYSDLKFNIGNYIALEMSLVWGVCSLIIIHFIRPILDKIIKKTPKFITILVLILFVIDFLYTVISRLV